MRSRTVRRKQGPVPPRRPLLPCRRCRVTTCKSYTSRGYTSKSGSDVFTSPTEGSADRAPPASSRGRRAAAGASRSPGSRRSSPGGAQMTPSQNYEPATSRKPIRNPHPLLPFPFIHELPLEWVAAKGCSKKAVAHGALQIVAPRNRDSAMRERSAMFLGVARNDPPGPRSFGGFYALNSRQGRPVRSLLRQPSHGESWSQY